MKLVIEGQENVETVFMSLLSRSAECVRLAGTEVNSEYWLREGNKARSLFDAVEVQ